MPIAPTLDYYQGAVATSYITTAYCFSQPFAARTFSQCKATSPLVPYPLHLASSVSNKDVLSARGPLVAPKTSTRARPGRKMQDKSQKRCVLNKAAKQRGLFRDAPECTPALSSSNKNQVTKWCSGVVVKRDVRGVFGRRCVRDQSVCRWRERCAQLALRDRDDDFGPSMLGTAFRFAFELGTRGWPWMTLGSRSSVGSSFDGVLLMTCR